jgi:predicted ATPase
MIVFEKVRYKNVLSTGNQFTEILLNRSPTTLIIGENGSGKCLEKTTKVDIEFIDKETEEKFKKFLSESI